MTISSDSVLHHLLAQVCETGTITVAELARAQSLDPERLPALLERLVELGVPLAVDDHRVSLERSCVLLDRNAIVEHMGGEAQRLGDLHLFLEIGSTNDHLLEVAPESAVEPIVCVAEIQSKGRGRRGREWVSPFAANLYFSMLYRWRAGAALGGLSIALGVAVAEALSDLGAGDVGIKWPNDLYWQRRKLGGLLVDVAGDPRRGCDVVAGVGINVDMHADTSHTAIQQPWCDLREILTEPTDRNKLAGMLASRWLRAFALYEREGLRGFLERYARFDICAGNPVVVTTANASLEGIARGVNVNGALLLETGSGIQAHYAADVSLRL